MNDNPTQLERLENIILNQDIDDDMKERLMEIVHTQFKKHLAEKLMK